VNNIDSAYQAMITRLLAQLHPFVSSVALNSGVYDDQTRKKPQADEKIAIQLREMDAG